MKRLCLWLQRLYILGFLLFAWHIAPFTRLPPLFPVVWSLAVAAAALIIPAPAGRSDGSEPIQGLLIGLLVGLTLGSVDWTNLDLTLLFELCWAFMPLFLFDRFFAWAWRRLHPRQAQFQQAKQAPRG